MKKKFIFILIFSFVIYTGCKNNGEQDSVQINTFKRYPFERLHLTYTFSGDARGTEEVFASDYGKYEAQISKSDIFSPQQVNQENRANITRIADVYLADYSKKTLEHNHLSYLDSLYHLNEKDIPASPQYMEFEMKRNLMKNTGTDTIAGKLASRWQLIDGNMTMWIWNGILVKKYAGNEEGYLDMTIKSIDTNWTVDTTKFMIPQGLTEVKSRNPNASPTN
jgi:hypothetical protein